MSGSTGAGAKPEKTMSSRLLTMKFMQRAAASNAAKEAQAVASDDSLASTSKRRRISTEPDSPSPPRTRDLDAIAAALAAEEEKRREAVARQAAEAGETEWVLDIPSVTNQVAPRPLVVAADSLDADDANVGGRRCYGNFKRKQPVTLKQLSEDAEKAASSQAEAKAEKKESRRKLINLSKLTSISGSRKSVSAGAPQKKKKRKSE